MKGLNILLILLVCMANFEGLLSEVTSPGSSEPSNDSSTKDPSDTSSPNGSPSTNDPSEPSTDPSEPSTESSTKDPNGSTTTTTTTTPDPRCEIIDPQCYRNVNGLCRFYDTPCLAEESKNVYGQAIVWTPTSFANCAGRSGEETKVCQLECALYQQGYCYPSGRPVCGYSKLYRQCRLFSNLCSLKQDACRFPGIKDWRVSDMGMCTGLRINGPAKIC